ncbi:hypothetical protein [Halorussus lipolyticus]|uniref:hypothetical protein n=1 Tax=Halorussus lipolyticus TaxID=3034024 RepID=UPI0023E89920|nr:hypothetical protein [Halorussus sp. DT80]
MPSRRDLLRTCGIGLSLGLAGCLGTDTESPSGTTTAQTTTSSPPTAEETTPAAVAERGVPIVPTVESTETRPFRAFSVGDREGVANPEDNLPHQIWVWNDTDRKREISVVVATGGQTVLDETIEYPARAVLGVELADPRAYDSTVSTADRQHTIETPRSRFDCNDSVTDVVVGPDEISEFTITTELACDTATVSES